MATQNDKECCNSCRFFSAGDRNMGMCRRYPSVVNTATNDWCGEYSISSPAFQAMMETIAMPIVVSETKKGRGRPKKS
jgi:hypothetical protein